MYKKNADLVSIIMPAYNAEKTISDSIDSVINQKYQNWELIVTDDCSTDRTLDILREYAKKDKRIKVISSKTNRGPALSRNSSISSSNGMFIAFLDSDDLWLPEKLTYSLSFAKKNPNVGLIYTAYRRISFNHSTIGRLIQVPKTVDYKTLLGGNVIATSTVLISRYIIKKIEMRDTYYDDFDCWLRLLKQNYIAMGLNIDLMRYRIVEDSISRNKIKSAMHVWRAYRKLEELNLLKTIYYFLLYSLRGCLKYFKF